MNFENVINELKSNIDKKQKLKDSLYSEAEALIEESLIGIDYLEEVEAIRSKLKQLSKEIKDLEEGIKVLSKIVDKH